MLVGREAEQRLLEGLLTAARAGTSASLALVGDVGMGKSALLEHTVARAAGMHVLRARGVQSETHIPFASLFELLRPALGHLEQVARPQREALEAALALRPAQASERFAIGAATLGLLAAYAETQPLLVAIDDAHWLDGSSADALLFAMRRLVADPIAVVLTVRGDLPSLLDGTDVPVHVLGGLDRDAARQLLGSAHSNEIVELVHRHTGGNPLALLELADDDWSPPGTPVPIGDRLAGVYLERCLALPARTQDLLLLVSVSDVGDLSLVAKAAAPFGLSVDDLTPAEQAGLVAVDAHGVEFRHPLVRSAVYHGAVADRRRSMHRALADALPDAEADRRAWHLALAALGPDDAASSSLEQAARRARLRSAYDVAAHAYERAAGLAVDDVHRSTLLLAAAESAWVGGLVDFAVALLERARRDARPDVAVSIDHLRGHIATRCGPLAEGQRILVCGAEGAARTNPSRAVVMLAEAVNAAFYAGDVARMREAAGRIATLQPAEERSAFFGEVARGMALTFGDGDGQEGAELLRRAVARMERSDALSNEPRLVGWAAIAPLWLREAGAGRSLLDRASNVARSQSAIGELPFLLTHVGIDHASSERWAEATSAFHEAIGFARETGQRTDLAFTLARLSLLEARQGLDDLFDAHVREARVLADETGAGLVEIWCLNALGEHELALGRVDRAARLFEDQATAVRARGIGDPDVSPEPELIELALRLGRPDDAAARMAPYEALARSKGQPWALARSARCRGLLAPDGEIDRHFADALSWHDRTTDCFETARTRLAYGSRLRRARQRVRAREELRAAIDVFDRLGARPWSEMAQRELGATGETARRRDPSTQQQLTPQELRIALLLAEGRTTREAASALFLSPKTIEYHLRSAYRKLGITSRDELKVAMRTSSSE